MSPTPIALDSPELHTADGPVQPGDVITIGTPGFARQLVVSEVTETDDGRCHYTLVERSECEES